MEREMCGAGTGSATLASSHIDRWQFDGECNKGP